MYIIESKHWETHDSRNKNNNLSDDGVQHKNVNRNNGGKGKGETSKVLHNQ